MIPPDPRVPPGVLPPSVHGGVDPGELYRLGLDPAQVLDFSANVNPFGPSPAARAAAVAAVMDRYPDRACGELTAALAARHRVGPANVLVGNGASELIWLAALAYLRPGDEVAILGPAFGGYERAARVMGATVRAWSADPSDGLVTPWDQFADGVRQHQTRLAFLATPANPTGREITPDQVSALAAELPGTLFIVDEAYADCVAVPAPEPTLGPGNLLRLRSLTKAHGLAGLRLGYAVGPALVIAALRVVQPPWSVNAPSQAAGLAAVADEAHRQATVGRWLGATSELVQGLRAVGFAPIPTSVPYFLMPVGDGAIARADLVRRGVLVRDCTSFGLSGFVRISSRDRADNAKLIQALVEARARGPIWGG